MINSISPVSVNKNYAPNFRDELPQHSTEPKKKEGISTTTKTLIGLGGLAALVIGGLLVKKSLKNIHPVFKDFSEKNLMSYLDDMLASGKIKDGDKVVFESKSKLVKDALEKQKPVAESVSALSDNGFAMFYKNRITGKYTRTCFDPETISVVRILEALKKRWNLYGVCE